MKNKKEIKIYCIDVNHLPNDMNKHCNELTDYEFMLMSEKTDSCYSLDEFTRAFNDNEISDANLFIRAIEVIIEP